MSAEEFIPTPRERATAFHNGEDVLLHAADKRLLSYEELARIRVGEALAAAVKTAPSGNLEMGQLQVEKEPVKPWAEIKLISNAMIKIRQAYRDSHIDLTADDTALAGEVLAAEPLSLTKDDTKDSFGLAA